MSVTFERMTDVIKAIVKGSLKGMTVYDDEGLDLEGFKSKYSLKQSETVYINLSQFSTDSDYINGQTIFLKLNYELFIRTSNDTVETVQKIQDSIYQYNESKVILNGVSNLIYTRDGGGSVINETDKFIQYNIEIYV